MKFSKIRIRNFRSVGPEGIEINFSKGRNLAALIGANGAGKTNILDALGIVLGVYPYSNYEIEESDFFNKDVTQELSIELYLDPPLNDRDVYQQEYLIYGFRFRAHRKTRGDGKGILTQENYCFNESSKVIVKPERIFKKAKEEDIDNTQRPIVVKDQSWKLGKVFYLDAPSLERFFERTTGLSPLARLFEIYRDDFPATANTYETEPGKAIQSSQAFQEFTQKLAAILRTKKLTDIESALSRHVGEYLGHEGLNPLKIEFMIPSHREIFEKWVGLQVEDKLNGPTLPVERLGSGYRALLRLAVIQTLLEMSDRDHHLIILIEEPEIYLHIHLRRYFRKLLKRIADMGHQVIFTTHAPEMIDLLEPHEAIRLAKTHDGNTSVHQVPDGVTFSSISKKVSRMGNEEILFANHAWLLEGRDDQAVIEKLLSAKGIDPDVHSISLIDCDSADSIPDYIKLCKYMSIDFYVCHDEDHPQENEIQARRNEKIENDVKECNKENSLHRYVPCLEAVMKKDAHCGVDALVAELDAKTYYEIAQMFPDLVKPIEQFVTTRSLDLTLEVEKKEPNQ